MQDNDIHVLAHPAWAIIAGSGFKAWSRGRPIFVSSNTVQRRTRLRRVPAAALLLALLTLSRSSPAPATVTPGAQRVLDRYLAAVGGRAAIDSTRTLYVHGAITAFGLSGTLRSWHRRPDSQASAFDLGPFKISNGFDGTRAWRTDPSGQLVILDGRDLEDARAQAWFENDRWLERDQGGGAIAEGGTEKDTLGTYTVIEVTPPAPPGGTAPRPRRLWFDDRTGLLSRVVSKRDQQTVISFASDYRAVQGRRVAFQNLTRIEGMPANDARLTLDSVVVNSGIDPARFEPPAASDSGLRWLKTPGVTQIPIEYASRHVWLHASVNGAPAADFLFDTGASVTVLDSAYAARIGIAAIGRQEGTGAGATGGASFATARTLTVAGPGGDGVEVRDLQIGVLELNRFLAPYFWREVAGVVGFDFIQRFVSTIDYDAGTLVLRDPRTFHAPGKGSAIPMQLAGTVPVVAMTLDSAYTGSFRVDVGSGATVDLHTPFVKEHDLLGGPGPRREVPGGGFGGAFRVVARRGKSLTIGPYSIPGPVLGMPQTSSGAFTSEDYAGNIGNQLLERFVCTFDYRHRVLYLEPGARFLAPDVFPRAGLLCVRVGERVEAIEVLPDSPAASAGIVPGDALIVLDGRPISAWSQDAVARILERGPVGSRHTLELERAGKRVRATVVLRELL